MEDSIIKVNWLKKAIIYQIFMGRWEGKIIGDEIVYVDNFINLKKRNWKKLSRLGINTIYLLGIFENEGPIIVGDENGRDLRNANLPRIPSLFALTNHKAFNKKFGSNKEFQDLLIFFHELGFRVIVDFVPNHTAVNHPWVKNHPEYYVKSNGQFSAEFSGDVYKLDYKNPDVVREMAEVLEWISNLGVDGVRCDMAHLIPNSFWKLSIEALKKRKPKFVFVAEAYPNSIFDYSNVRQMYESGFDAIYNNGLFENFKKVVVENNPQTYILECLRALRKNQPGYIVNYFSNHDDPVFDNKKDSLEISGLSYKYFEALLGIILFIPDIPFIFNGSLRGKVTRLAHHWFEPLEKYFLETENALLPIIEKLFEIRKLISEKELGEINQLRLENDLLIFSKGSYEFIFNFGKENKFLNCVRQNKKGLIHWLDNKDELLPGMIEIFS